MTPDNTEPTRDSDEQGATGTETHVPPIGTPEHDTWVRRIVDPILAVAPVTEPTLTEKIEVYLPVITALRRAGQPWPSIAAALQRHRIDASADVLRVLYNRIRGRRAPKQPPARAARVPVQVARPTSTEAKVSPRPEARPSGTQPNLARRLR